MMSNQEDNTLLDYVNRMINSGTISFDIPMSLIQNASKEILEEVRRLCKLAGVKVGIKSN